MRTLIVGLLASIGLAALGAGCKPVTGLSGFMVKDGASGRADVVWILRGQDEVYRCFQHDNRPYCVKAVWKE